MMRLLITGAAGSGTSTLAAALATQAGMSHLEADDYYWLPSEPPYTEKRASEERIALLLGALNRASRVVVAGSVMGWGERLEQAFDGVVFLHTGTALRLARLEARERQRFGGARPEFLAWAAAYDAGTASGRSLAGHRHWLRARNCPVLELEGDQELEDLVVVVMTFLNTLSH